jgi:hypothetical protein
MEPTLFKFLISALLAIQLMSKNYENGFNLDRGSAHPAFEHAVGWSFTPDVSGMAYEERESYLGSIGQGPGGR